MKLERRTVAVAAKIYSLEEIKYESNEHVHRIKASCKEREIGRERERERLGESESGREEES